MNINPIKQIYRFNKEAGLLDEGYNDIRESAYPIEEMLETFVNDRGELYFTGVNNPDLPLAFNGNTPKELSRELIKELNVSTTCKEVDFLDKYLDTIIFSFGSIFKLGLTTQQAMKALEVVMNTNMQKLKMGQDSEGKQMKPTDFVGPEEQLQKILDER